MERLAAALRALAKHAAELAAHVNPRPVRQIPQFRPVEQGGVTHWEEEETSWVQVLERIRPALAETEAWGDALALAPECFAGAPLPVQDDLAVGTFLVRFLERADGEWSEEVFETTLQELRGFVEFSGEIEASITAPLEHLRGDVKRLDLPPHCEIVKLDSESHQKLWREFGLAMTRLDPWAVAHMSEWTHLLTVRAGRTEFRAMIWPELQDGVESALMALRLERPGRVDVPYNWISIGPTPLSYYAQATGVMVGGLLGRPSARLRYGPYYQLQADQSATLPRTMAQHVAAKGTSRTLDLAYRRFASAYARRDAADRLIDYWVAFEALFLPEKGPELKYRASTRIARFVGDRAEDRRALLHAIRLSYDARSHVVHGGSPTDLPRALRQTTLDAIADETEEALRRALRRWADPGFPHDIGTIDEAMMD